MVCFDINSTIVAADIVAMDSPLPLKNVTHWYCKRRNYQIYEKKLTEKQLSDIDTLVAKK
jgi:hypothetical protein